MAGYKVVGKRVPRTDSVPKATGAARFTADISLPRMLYGKILRSPHPHARILSIDTSRAERLPGVRAVVTAADTMKRKYGLFANTRDQHFLAAEKVRYVGDEVAAVAAVDEDIAEEALELIRVEYELLPAVFDPQEAMGEDAPRLHDGVENNVGWALKLTEGNPEEAFGRCAHVIEDRFFSEKISHVPMEPYGALANFEAGKLHIWAPNMAPFTKRKGLSNMLGLPVPMVRIHHVTIGGAFGSRSDTYPMEFSAALLSMKSGRPVRIQCTQDETMAVTRMMHGAVMDVKMGFAGDGTLLAGDIRFILDGGAYLSSGVMATNAGGHHYSATYRMPNFKYEGLRVYTNKTTCNMHSNHPSNLTMALEQIMDRAAEAMGMDSLDLRLKNAIKANETLANESVISSCGLSECLTGAAEVSGWKAKRGKLPRGRGIGMGCGVCTSGFPLGMRLGSAAFVKLNEDGSATVTTGAIDNGQGNESMMVQVAAEELGIAMKDIALVNGDTELTPQDPGTYSMTATFVSANAVRLAGADARRQMLQIASDRMGVRPEELDITDGRVHVREKPEMGIPVEDVARLSLLAGTPVMGRGAFMPKPHSPQGWADLARKKPGQQGPTYTFGTSVAEVEVDEDTGKVNVLKLTLVDDMGFAINPMAVEGQMEGFAEMLLGQALYEEHHWDTKSGKLLTPLFDDYRIPTALDIPTFETRFVETIDPDGPYGGKDVGIGGTGGVIAAIVNAIYDAVGVRVKSLPVSSERLLEALRKGEGSGA